MIAEGDYMAMELPSNATNGAEAMSGGEEGSDASEPYASFFYNVRFIMGLFLYPSVCIFGLVGNVLAIIVMCQKQMRSSTNVYLLALAIADTIKIISDFLYFIVILLLNMDKQVGQEAYSVLYPYAHYILNSSLCISAWITVALAVERYIYVCHPTKVRGLCSIKIARVICTAVFVSMSLMMVPNAMRYRTVEVYSNETQRYYTDLTLTDLWLDETFSKVYTWIQNILRSLIPLFLLIILNTCIIYGVRKCRVGRTKTSKRHRISIMLIVVILVFLLCITPDAVMSTFFAKGYHEADCLTRGIREITDFLLLLNAAINFVIYCIFNTVFWRNFVRLFCQPCCGQDRGGQGMEESHARRNSLVGRPKASINIRLGSNKDCGDGLLSEV